MARRCVIVGAGLAGCVLANALSDDFEVTVLELGPARGITYPRLAFPRKTLGVVNTFCHGRGGTSNLWHNGLIPLRPDDVGDATFKAMLEDAARYADRAAAMLHFPGESYSRSFAGLLNDVESLAAGIGTFADGVDTLVYPKHTTPLSPPSSAECAFDVRSIRVETSGERITRVSWSTPEGDHSADADLLVVSAGAFGTPGVLTDVLEPFGIDPGKAGSGVIDHPMGFVGKLRFPKSVADSVAQFGLLDRGDHECRSMIRLRSDDGLLGCAYFRPCLSMNNDLSIYKYKSLLGASSGRKRLRNALSPRILHPDIVSEIVSHTTGLQIPTRTYSVLFMGEQRERVGGVHTDGDTHTIDWGISDAELGAYSSMIDGLFNQLADVAETATVTRDLTDEWLWSGAHHSGTVTVGDADSDLLTADLQVRNTANVFVCDASVIQEHSYANTGLTIAQLALRLADALRR